MKIESLYISAFGKFKDYRLVFSDSLNLFYGENEVGKTTLMTFIKMMFYGSGIKGNDLLKNPRKKYMPWDNSAMAGSIDFSFEDKLYRIERIFGASNTSDKVTLIDLDTGTRETISGTTELGAKFFGLSSAAFERCVFIGQLNLGESATDSSGELNSKLSSLALSGEEDISEKQIAARLLSAKEELMSKSGRKGKYDIGRLKLASLNEELLSSRNTEEERETLATRIENQKNRLSLVLKEIDRINASLKATESKRNFKKLKDYIESLEQLSSFEKKLLKADGTVISVSDLSKTEDAVAKYKLLKSRLPDLEKEISILTAEIDAEKSKNSDKNDPITLVREKLNSINLKIAEAKKKYGDLTQEVKSLKAEEQENLSKKPTVRISLVISSLIGILALIVSLVLKLYPVAVVGGCVFAVFGILALTLKKKPQGLSIEKAQQLKNAQSSVISLQNDISVLSAELNTQNDLLKALTADCDSATALREEKISLKENRVKELDELKQELSELEKLFSLMFPKENMTASVSGMEIVLHAYKEYSRKVEAAKTKIAILKADLGDLSKQAAEIELSKLRQSSEGEDDPKALEDRLSYKQKEATEIQKSIAYDEASARTKFSSHRHPTDIEHEIEALSSSLSSQKEFCDSIDIAIDALNTAFNSTRRSFGAVLEKRTAQIFSSLTDNRYSNVNISKDFDVAVQSNEIFGSREWQYLSSGTADQVYFSLRLAVSELLAKELGGLPVFIDDAFAQYDDTRLKQAIAFLEEYSRENQVLYFTCHKAGLENKENLNTLV